MTAWKDWLDSLTTQVNFHKGRHENGGADEIDLDGLSGDPADTVNKSDFNAKADLLTASANDTPVILPVGANGEFLVPNSSTSTGLEWVGIVTYEGVVVVNEGQVVYT